MIDPFPVSQRRHAPSGLAIPYGGAGIIVEREHVAPISAQLSLPRLLVVKGNAPFRSAVPQSQLISEALNEQGHHVPIESRIEDLVDVPEPGDFASSSGVPHAPGPVFGQGEYVLAVGGKACPADGCLM